MSVAVIDGPYDAVALSCVLAQAPLNLGNYSCSVNPNDACMHGTFIMGMLGARRDALIPGLCPGSKLLHVPLFVDENAPWASVAALARAITIAVRAGARLINLSLAIQGDDAPNHRELSAALDFAEASGAVVVVAAGNQGRLAMGQLLSHGVAIPVVAVDAARKLLSDCNYGPSISRHGVATLGHAVLGYAPGGGTTVMSGTSVATAVATGTLAALWSTRPDASGAEIRAAVARLSPRDGPTPPPLEQHALLAALDETNAARIAVAGPAERGRTNYVGLQGERMMSIADGPPRSLNRGAGPTKMSGQAVTPAHGSDGCACGAPGGVCTCADGELHFVYVLGSVDVRFPDQSISGELQELALALPNGTQGANETERDWCYRILTGVGGGARYIARQLHWILRVEAEPAYYLALRDLHDLDDLINCLGQPIHDDLCLFVGSSSLEPVDIRPGIKAPLLDVDRLCWFEKQDILSKFKTPSKKGLPGPNELYKELFQSADNFGHTDGWRALNYLAVRHPPLYDLCSDMVHDGYELKGFPVMTSRLADWGTKRIVDAVFTFGNTQSGVIKKYFVRVDVSHLFPMLVNPIAKYIDH